MWMCQYCGAEVEEDWERCWNCTQPKDPSHHEAAVVAPVTPVHQRCLNCGSTKLIPDFLLRTVFYSRDNQTHIQLSEHVGPRFLTDNLLELRGDVCGECGHVHLRVHNPKFLWQVYQQLLAKEIQPEQIDEDEDQG